MKRTLSIFFITAVVALSAISGASARMWSGQTKQLAPAKHSKKAGHKSAKTNYAAYYRGPH